MPDDENTQEYPRPFGLSPVAAIVLAILFAAIMLTASGVLIYYGTQLL